jgi:hypothetical protein
MPRSAKRFAQARFTARPLHAAAGMLSPNDVGAKQQRCGQHDRQR